MPPAEHWGDPPEPGDLFRAVVHSSPRRAGKTLAASSARVTRLDADGRPTGPSTTLGIGGGPITVPDSSPKADPPPDPDEAVETLQPMLDIAKALKTRLQDQGWTYETAEDVAAHFIKSNLTKIVGEIG